MRKKTPAKPKREVPTVVKPRSERKMRRKMTGVRGDKAACPEPIWSIYPGLNSLTPPRWYHE